MNNQMWLTNQNSDPIVNPEIMKSYIFNNAEQQIKNENLRTQFNGGQMQSLLEKLGQITNTQQEASQQNIGKKKVRQTYQRAIKQEYVEFQQLFSQKLKEIIVTYVPRAMITNDQELCIQINDYFKNSGQKDLWKQLNEQIPTKTIKQLREYYQKSFQRVLYDNQIDVEDKETLRQLMEQMTDDSPTSIANSFCMISKNKNYFKRNIVMYIINLKRK
ncbi:Hypothetical_protein [Hexamita inflata]|uniref:Hypothetical_protein n=1 Tax=Hexamita inflata TaxID=28002 RepID=A0AA86U8R9_9EUKA|nr:Hypothetical protein HINF_LOCUS33314 [Hexamita inflata]